MSRTRPMPWNDADCLEDISSCHIDTIEVVEELFFYYGEMGCRKPGFTLTLLRRIMSLSTEKEDWAATQQRMDQRLRFCDFEHVSKLIRKCIHRESPEKFNHIFLSAERFKSLVNAEIKRIRDIQLGIEKVRDHFLPLFYSSLSGWKVISLSSEVINQCAAW